MKATSELHRAIAAVCPILGVSVGDPKDTSTWRIDFDPSATKAQMSAAQAVIPTWVYADVVEPDSIAVLKAQVAALNAKVGIAISSIPTG